MRTLDKNKTAVALLGGLALVGALAGCSTPPADTTADDAAAPTEEATTPAETTETVPDAGASTYTDGTYTESGSYQTPNGTESVEVTLTLADDVITAVEVTGSGGSRDTQEYQGQFIDGIDAVVVGKNIDEISVSKVAGSSLTSGGFTQAVDAIKADAA